MKKFLVLVAVGLIFAGGAVAQHIRSHFQLSASPVFVISPKMWSSTPPVGSGLKYGVGYDGKYTSDISGINNFYLVTTVGGVSLISASQNVSGKTIKSNENIFHILEGVEYIGSGNDNIVPHFGLNAGISVFGKFTTDTNNTKSVGYPSTYQPRIAVSGSAGLILFPADNYGIDLSLEYEIANAALRSKNNDSKKSIAFDTSGNYEHYVSFLRLNVGITFRLTP